MKRLKAISDFIYPYRRIADIGSDHGYLIKIAFYNNLIDYAYAIDNKKGPINSCKNNLKEYKNVSYFLSDGLDDVDESIDCIIIAGMGGMLIISILEKNKDKLKNIKRLILQANRDEYLLRKYLVENGFYIQDEKIIKEDNKYYEIDCFEKGYEEYDFNDLYFGKILMKNKDDVFIEKWNNKYQKFKNIKAYSTDTEKIKIMKGIEQILCK